MAGTETRKKEFTTTLRLDADEREALRRAAEAAGVGPSTFARLATLRAAGRKAEPPHRRDPKAVERAPILGELGRWGSNLNQLSRHAHQGGRVDAAALDELTAAVEILTKEIMAQA